MPFVLEHNLPRAKGSIKQEIEDFIVEEVMPDGTILETDKKIEREDKEGKFLHFVLQKKEWSTEGAISRIARAMHAKIKRFNYAGTKDKRAITTQLVSGFAIDKKALANLKLKDIQINGMWTEDKKVKMGDLLGNRFSIKINGLDENAEKRIKIINEKLNNKFVNYFGEQRFGTVRKNTHLVGEQIIKENYKGAVLEFLTNTKGEINKEARNARQNLKETLDYKKAFEEFPQYLRLERTMIEWLKEHPKDYVNALRKIPRGISLLFVHAFQSYLFNLELSERVEAKDFEAKDNEYYCASNFYGFPNIEEKVENGEKGWLCTNIIGYESKTNKIEEKLLQRFSITKENFKLKQFTELSSRGTFRPFFAPYKNFEFKKEENKKENKKEEIFTFELPSGCYATVLLNNFIY